MAFRVLVLIGAVASFFLMLHVGRGNRSIILPLLFTLWDLFPFAALLWISLTSNRWSARARKVLHSVMSLIAIGSVTVYAYAAYGPRRSTPAAPFLMVPLCSWVLILAAWVGGARSRNKPERAINAPHL